jgi:DNA repair exonuclease SbcCD ATPase subunit
MTRYFIKGLQIEGFRGINNQGDPLELSFKTDRVNSIFAANALGKSSIFEALSFALRGTVPKLDCLPSADNPAEYYANRFHGTGVATINIRLEPDDSSSEIEIAVSRDQLGSRVVTSPSGFPNPEEFLRTLDTELALLDHEMFMKFISDTPLTRGRTFSGLLGLSPLSEFRQALQILSNLRNLNTDFELDSLKRLKEREEQAVKDVENRLRKAFRAFFSNEPTVSLDLIAIGDATLTALKSVPVIASAINDSSFSLVNFENIRAAIKRAEASEKRDRLLELLRSIKALQALGPPPSEEGEKTTIRELLQERVSILAQTKGELFQRLYLAVQKLYAQHVWNEALVCPVCESCLAERLPERVAQLLAGYQQADESLRLVRLHWNESKWAQRLKKLEDADAMGVPASSRQFSSLTSKFNGTEPSIADLDSAISRLEVLDGDRNGKIATLQVQKEELERQLPPSLVALTEQVEHASDLQQTIKELQGTNQRLANLTASLSLRLAWATFIGAVSDELAQAEVRFSTSRTGALESDYRTMYEQVTKNPEIVPLLKKSESSEELHLRLAKFYGLTDLSAATLLPESYRNALAICIYLAAALRTTNTARFIVLDDVTSSFDAGHQWALMELIRTKIAYPGNPNGPQIIVLSHDSLLEKYFDTMASETEWHHQRLHGLPPKGIVYPQTQDINRLEKVARQQLSAGQTELAQPLIRQYLEQKLLQLIRKLEIPVPLDFSIREDRKMTGNCIDAISNAINLHKKAGTLVLQTSQLLKIETIYVPALVANWISHHSTGASASLSPYVLLGVLDSINDLCGSFMYECNCTGSLKLRFYRNLYAKACSC